MQEIKMARAKDVGFNFTRQLKGATSLTKDHMVMQIESDGTVGLCDDTNRPYAIAFRSTLSRLDATIGNEVFLTGSQLADGGKEQIPLFRSGWAVLNVAKNNAAISIGDMIVVSDETGEDGKVEKGNPATATEFARRVGWAEEDVVAGAAAKAGAETIMVSLDILGGSP